jgi:hypothetical protein
MPFKASAAGRPHIPKQKRKVTNWFRQRSRHWPCSVAPGVGIGRWRGRPDRWDALGAAQPPFQSGATAPLGASTYSSVVTSSVAAPIGKSPRTTADSTSFATQQRF